MLLDEGSVLIDSESFFDRETCQRRLDAGSGVGLLLLGCALAELVDLRLDADQKKASLSILNNEHLVGVDEEQRQVRLSLTAAALSMGW